jgi:hypothetical protein
MGIRSEHRKYNLETLGSDSEIIEKTFIDRDDLIRKHTSYHRNYGGHDSHTRNILFATFGQRGIDEFDAHMEMDEFDYHDNDSNQEDLPSMIGKLVKSISV